MTLVYWPLGEPAKIAVIKSKRIINSQTRKPRKTTARKWEYMESSKTSVGTVANRGTKYLTSGRVKQMKISVQNGTTKIKKNDRQ